MTREDTFKQVYLALVVAMIGLKWLFVPFALAQRIADIGEFRALSELRIIVPTAALLAGAAQVARRGSLHGGIGLTLMFAVFGLGCALAIFDGFGGAALLRPVATVTQAPLAVLAPAALWAVQSVTAWLFGGWVMGTLFWLRPGLDEQSSISEPSAVRLADTTPTP